MDTPEAIQKQNDALMNTAYKIIEEAKNLNSTPSIFLWGGGAINHFLDGKMDYRVMSDLEYLIFRKDVKLINEMLKNLGFFPYKSFNNMQKMQKTTMRQEHYLPDRELDHKEELLVEDGYKNQIEDVNWHKVELFCDGIRMCWEFGVNDIPSAYLSSVIAPVGFQLALKANAIVREDLADKDIQDISRILNLEKMKIADWDTIFEDAKPLDELFLGTKVLERLAIRKYLFADTIIRNLDCCFPDYLTEEGKQKVFMIQSFLQPYRKADAEVKGLRKMLRLGKEKPNRVDQRER